MQIRIIWKVGIVLTTAVIVVFLTHYISEENEKNLLSDLRLLAVPHSQLHDIGTVTYSGTLKFSNLFRYTEPESGNFGLVYKTENKVFQLILPSGNVYRFQNINAWNEKRAINQWTVEKISCSNVWFFIGSNKYQNLSGTKTKSVEQATTNALSAANWLLDFWVSNKMSGCFVTDTNSCHLFYAK